jgi:hypothetical protein
MLFGFSAVGSLLTAPSGYVPHDSEGDSDVVCLTGGKGVGLDCFSRKLVEVLSAIFRVLCVISFFVRPLSINVWPPLIMNGSWSFEAGSRMRSLFSIR